MWRRVLSQSPSSVPEDPESARRTRDYLEGWQALGALLHSGHSLSGRERNCCFLNLGGSRFVDAASAIGFDQPADSRGIGVVDWDDDGDLDLWLTNRTSPRVRYLRNDIPAKHHFVAIRLRGVTCNRDAIGARVELFLEGEQHPQMIRSVTAGEGFISQSSKWVHFGIGPHGRIDRMTVRWPGGTCEDFRGIEANGRYVLEQGSGQTIARKGTPTARPLAVTSPTMPSFGEARRTVLARRTPMPRLELRNLDGQPVALTDFGGRPTLVNLWASWCEPCLKELESWKAAKPEFDRLSLAVLAVNVDFADDGPLSHLPKIRDMWTGMRSPLDCYVIDASGFELLEIVDRIHYLHRASLPIPSSYLIDSSGGLAVIYKGPVDAEQLVRDVAHLAPPSDDPRDGAVPFRGKWFSDPFPANLTAVPFQLNGRGRAGDSFDYIMRHIATPQHTEPIDAWSQLGVPPGKVMKLLHETAVLLEQAGRAADAATLYEKSLLYDPDSWESRQRLAALLIRLNRSREALAVSREMTKLRQDHPLPWNNIAWIMATSRDPSIRDVRGSVELAERICRATRNREPTALDTLAVAYAAAGRFEDARATARKAIELAESLNIPELSSVLRARLQLFENNQAYEQPDSPNANRP
jgi:thiol-disulfide isomerase/thioredoxin